jgi:hypothetical protein
MRPERRRSRWSAVLASSGAAAGAIFAPKCPLCVVAALSACGVGVGLGTAGLLASIARPLAMVVAALALAVEVWPFARWMARRRAAMRRRGASQARAARAECACTFPQHGECYRSRGEQLDDGSNLTR